MSRIEIEVTLDHGHVRIAIEESSQSAVWLTLRAEEIANRILGLPQAEHDTPEAG